MNNDKNAPQALDSTAENGRVAVIGGSYFRPKTRGELKEKLQDGCTCEVIENNMDITNLCLDGWLDFKGKYKNEISPNFGWVLYIPV